ncbi:MAG: hypothetical protein ACJAZ9_000736 [Neolewinella sp.]|jgi:hypothetical protein
MIGFQLVVQHRVAGVLTSTNFNLDALAVPPFTNETLVSLRLCKRFIGSVSTTMITLYRPAAALANQDSY